MDLQGFVTENPSGKLIAHCHTNKGTINQKHSLKLFPTTRKLFTNHPEFVYKIHSRCGPDTLSGLQILYITRMNVINKFRLVYNNMYKQILGVSGWFITQCSPDVYIA